MDSRSLIYRPRGLGATTTAPTDAQLRALAAQQAAAIPANATGAAWSQKVALNAYASGTPYATLLAQGQAPNMVALQNAFYAQTSVAAAPVNAPVAPTPVSAPAPFNVAMPANYVPASSGQTGGTAVLNLAQPTGNPFAARPSPTTSTASPVVAGVATPYMVAVSPPSPVSPVVVVSSPAPATPIPTQTNTQGQPVYTPPAITTPSVDPGALSYSGGAGDSGGGGYVLASDLYGTSATPDGTTTTPTSGATAVDSAASPLGGLFSGVIAIPGIGNVPAPAVYGSVAILAWLLLRGKKGSHGY